MTPEETIFAEALRKRSATEQVAYLDLACAGNADLRRDVEALLLAHRRVEGILEVYPLGLDTKTLSIHPVESVSSVGSMVGPYKLLEQIGEGGMGVVYMAEQREPIRRRVALKIIKAGMDTRQVVARFEAERQALAMMDHPSIAKVFDAGATEAGRPYFVMELVRGIPITTYCSQQKLSVEARLKLFVQVCGAVQHAHQKGIIHRDLKPSNVMVAMHDDKPVPMVIDFGIAKATQGRLTDKTLFTEFRQMIGTPAYMSPEQALRSAIDVDTRTDIYSLGVLLYELLTGTTPFESNELLHAALDEVRRIIHESDPPRPSVRISSLAHESLALAANQRQCDPRRLSDALRGDLDCIVMKCIEKDRTRRYDTASSLGLDVDRHLRNEPVVAQLPTWTYRARKWSRRNGVTLGIAATVTTSLFILALLSTGIVLAAVGAVTIALFAGVVVSTGQAVRASRAEREQCTLRLAAEKARALAEVARDNEAIQRENAQASEGRAQKRFQEVQKLARVLMFDLHEKVKDLAGATPALEMMARTAQSYLEVLSVNAGEDASLLADLAQAYEKMGDIQGNPFRATGLGDFQAALASYRKSLDLHKTLLKLDSSSAADQRGVAACSSLIAQLLFNAGESSEAVKLYEEATNVFQKLVSDNPRNTRASMDLASCIRAYADVQADMGDCNLCLENLFKVKDLYFRLGLLELTETDATELKGRVAAVYWDIAGMLVSMGRTLQGLDYYNQCLTEFTAISKRLPSDARARRSVAVTQMGIGHTLCVLGDAKGSADEYRAALDILQSLACGDPDNAPAVHAVAVALQGLGDALAASGEHDAALEQYAASLALVRMGPDADAAAQVRRGGTLYRIADSLVAKGDVQRALETYGAIVPVAEKLAAADANNPQYQRNLAAVYCMIGRAHDKDGRPQDALVYFAKSLPLLEKLVAIDPVNILFRESLAMLHTGMGDALAQKRDIEGARENYQKGVAHYQALSGIDVHNAQIRSSLCDALASLGLLHVQTAKDATSGFPESSALWRNAREWLTLADEERHKLKNDPKINSAPPEHAAAIQPAIDACNVAIASC